MLTGDQMSKQGRDHNIKKSYRKEIDLRTKVVKDKTKYTRKQKHKQKD